MSNDNEARSADVVQLNRHDRMTPEEALAVASRQKWKTVLVIGYSENDTFMNVASDQTKSESLWLLEDAKETVRR